MRIYFATNVVDPPEELWAFGGKQALCSFAYLEQGGAFLPKATRTITEFWLASRAEKEERLRVFFAGNVKSSQGVDANAIDSAEGVRHRLLTFADVDGWAREAFEFWVQQATPPSGARVFLDSGAFSAYTRKATIDLGRYCDYIKQHSAALDCYAALDVIGDWRATAKNVAEMCSRGLQPLPTFHRGSPWEELDRIAAEHPYIALGGMVGGQGKRGSVLEDDLSPHLDHCFRVLEKRWPVKVHAFGVIAQWVLERYPFFSADSATAIMGAGMGRVIRFRDGQLRSGAWTDDVARTWDGAVADGVGRASKDGGSKSAHAGRRRRNVEALLAYERYLTRLWTARGISWA